MKASIKLLVILTIVFGCRAFFSSSFGARSSNTAASRGAPSFASHSTGSAAGDQRDVLVVGCGISGCTAAFYLSKAGVDVLAVDVGAEVGGNLASRKVDGFQWEEGPNSFQPSPTILRFAKDIDLLNDLVLADSKLPRFVYWDGSLHALPGGLADLPAFDLLTCQGKLRAGLGMLGLVAPKPAKEESIKEFVERHLGSETFERIVDPFVSGVYAGDPTKLSMQSALGKIYGLEGSGIGPSLLGGGIARLMKAAPERRRQRDRNGDLPNVPSGSLGSFKDGLQSMALRVKEKLGSNKVRLSYKLLRVVKDEQGYVSTFSTQEGEKVVRSRAIVMTSPSHVTASLLGAKDSGLLPQAAALSSIRCPPVASVTLAYPNSAFKVKVQGFGHLIPRSTKIRTLGTIWTSSLFPGRAPPGYTMLTSFIGGSQDPEIANLTQEQIVAQVHADVKQIMLTADAPAPKVVGVKLWPRAIPQYEIGHSKILADLAEGLKSTPGLFLGGNYRTGVSLGHCVQFGVDVAGQVQDYLRSSREKSSTYA